MTIRPKRGIVEFLHELIIARRAYSKRTDETPAEEQRVLKQRWASHFRNTLRCAREPSEIRLLLEISCPDSRLIRKATRKYELATHILRKQVPWLRDLPPTEAQELQRRSFAYGNAAMSNPNITREMIDDAADRLRRES